MESKLLVDMEKYKADIQTFTKQKLSEQEDDINRLTIQVSDQKVDINRLTIQVSDQKANNKKYKAAIKEYKSDTEKLTMQETDKYTVDMDKYYAYVKKYRASNRKIKKKVKMLMRRVDDLTRTNGEQQQQMEEAFLSGYRNGSTLGNYVRRPTAYSLFVENPYIYISSVNVFNSS